MTNMIVYGQENCNYCTLAKKLLDEKKIPYEYFDIHNDGVNIETLVTKTAPGAKTVPIVISNGIWIGGYTELKAHLASLSGIVTNLRKMLVEGLEVYVSFFKEDGSVREMLCTTNPEKIPAAHLPKTEGTKISAEKPDPNLLTVFDLEKKAWRSFRTDRLIKVV